MTLLPKLVGRTLRGSLVSAEFRLCASPPAVSPASLAHRILQLPQLEAGEGVPMRLAKALRPDQQAALRFLVDSELRPWTLRCSFAAFVRMKPAGVAVGGHARVKSGDAGASV